MKPRTSPWSHILAHKAVQRAIWDGLLQPPAACEVCGRLESHHRLGTRCLYHHWSYLPQHALDVIPLCTSCHGKVHHGSIPEPRTGRRHANRRVLVHELAAVIAEYPRARADALVTVARQRLGEPVPWSLSTAPDDGALTCWFVNRRADAVPTPAEVEARPAGVKVVGITRGELAGRLCMSEDDVAAWEENRSRPKDKDRPAVAAALGVPLHWLAIAAAGGDAYVTARAAAVPK